MNSKTLYIAIFLLIVWSTPAIGGLTVTVDSENASVWALDITWSPETFETWLYTGTYWQFQVNTINHLQAYGVYRMVAYAAWIGPGGAPENPTAPSLELAWEPWDLTEKTASCPNSPQCLIMNPDGASYEATLTYARSGSHGTFSGTRIAAVVPEPISSILFIVGGAILGFRRFRKIIN